MTTRAIRRVVLTANNVGGLGGVSTFLRTTARAFAERGYDVELVGFDQVEMHGDFSGLRVRTMFDRPTPETPRRSDYVLGARDPRYRRRRADVDELRKAGQRRLATYLEELGGETAIICAQVFAMENFLGAGFDPWNRTGPLTFGQHHGSFFDAKSGGYVPRIRRAYAGLDRFVALTAEDAELFTLAGVPSTTSIPNMVTMPESDADAQSRTVVSLGRYHKQKRLDRMIQAWHQLSAEFPHWRLDLWGEGILRPDLQRLIDQLDESRAITLRGATSDVAGVLSGAALNVLTSDHEGLPIAIVEASRRSVPTVAMDCCPGIRELIDDGETGTVVPAKSTMAMVEALRTLMTEHDTRLEMGREACVRSRQYSPDSVLDRWEEEFERALR